MGLQDEKRKEKERREIGKGVSELKVLPYFYKLLMMII